MSTTKSHVQNIFSSQANPFDGLKNTGKNEMNDNHNKSWQSVKGSSGALNRNPSFHTHHSQNSFGSSPIAPASSSPFSNIGGKFPPALNHSSPFATNNNSTLEVGAALGEMNHEALSSGCVLDIGIDHVETRGSALESQKLNQMNILSHDNIIPTVFSNHSHPMTSHRPIQDQTSAIHTTNNYTTLIQDTSQNSRSSSTNNINTPFSDLSEDFYIECQKNDNAYLEFVVGYIPTNMFVYYPKK